jgi:hypothetical protein
MLLLGCCCHDYETGIDITFYRYQTNNTPRAPFMAVRHMNDYIAFLRKRITDKFFPTNKNFSSFGERDSVTIRILSNPDDHIYDGEYAQEAS